MKNMEIVLDFSFDKVVCTNKEQLKKGDKVLVNIDNIVFSGQVIRNNLNIETENFVIRKVTTNDLIIIDRNNDESQHALKEANKIKNKLGLTMNFVDSYYTYDRKQLFFMFVADNRVDFRELAKKLADKYRTRIELRQIGIRDKAKQIGGIGPCGLFLCCNSFLTDFNSVSINMAKNQFLALNPSKINGVCGRLLCCLNYENKTYSELKNLAPKYGSIIDTPKGKGKVVAVDIFKMNCSVELNDKTVVTVDYAQENESIK